MNIALGDAGLVLSLVACVAGAATLVAGLRRNRDGLLRSGRSYVWLILLGAVVATVAMQHALITRDFTLRYVANNDSLGTPLLFRITAMWSALEGSILLWALILSGYLVVMVWAFRRRASDALVAWATVTGYVVAAFFFLLMLTASNPFTHSGSPTPTNGPGPDPLLQDHVLVAFHPPMLYLGLVGFTIPFCFAVASLVTGRVGEGWLIETRRWTLFAWAFLTGGVILGAWWSYQVLNWGGYWAWDPVENAAFLPWLTATAYLHSVMVQERRGMLRVWNLSLLSATFSLTILGTFLTRSGVLDSVHSFSNSNIGPELLAFFGVVVAASVGLLAWRGDRLRSPGLIDSPLSREGAFLANNLLFGAFAFVVLLGTVFPLIAQAVGDQITVGGPYFNTMTMPIVVCLLFIMAVAPVLPWRKASGELLRHRLRWPAVAAFVVLAACVAAGVRGLNPLLAFGLGAFAGASALRQLALALRRQGVRGMLGRANGGMIVHIGVVVVAVAFAASHSFAHAATFQLKPGQTVHFEGHRFTYQGLRQVTTAQKSSIEASVRVDGSGVYRPAVSNYPGANQAIGTPSVRSTPASDIYLTLTTVPSAATGAASISVRIEPLVMWVWAGGGIVVAGTLLAAWPGRRRRRPTEPASAAIADVPVRVGERASPPELAPTGGKASPRVTETAPRELRLAAPPPSRRVWWRRRRVTWAALGIAALVAALFAVLTTAPQQSSVTANSPLLGKPAPAAGGSVINGPGQASLGALGGHWVLVNFFASWCQPCQQELPQLKAFQAGAGRDAPATVFGIEYDPGDAGTARAYLAAQKAGVAGGAGRQRRRGVGGPRDPRVVPGEPGRDGGRQVHRRRAGRRRQRRDPRPERTVTRWWRWGPAVLLVVAVIVVLVIGSQRPSHQTLDQRTMSLAGQVRCPVCSGETAAESNTPPSVEIRSSIHSWLQAGDSTGQVKAKLVASYGPGILEKPAAKGIGLLVWVLPLVVVAAAAGGLALAFVGWRRRSRAAGVPTDVDRALVTHRLGAGPSGPARGNGG